MHIHYKNKNIRARNVYKFWPLWLVLINESIAGSTARESRKNQFQYFTNIRTGTLSPENPPRNEVCLSTQSTIHRIQTIGEVASFWQGPISLVVFVYDQREVQFLLKFLNWMVQCNPWFKKTVSVHLAAQKSLKINITHLHSNLESSSSRTSSAEICKEAPTFNSTHMNCKRNFYPQNHMRNFAKKNCNTFWTLSTDVDVIPSRGSAALLRTFLSTEAATSCFKCAFVIPVFETKLHPKDFPGNKSELAQLVQKKLISQFHAFYDHIHGSTDYKRWFESTPTDQVEISHDVKVHFRQVHDKRMSNWRPGYDPFYVVPMGVPEYDERFLGFGRTRNSQVLETVVAGYSLKVLTPLYLIHIGKSSGTKNVLCFRQRLMEAGINKRIHAPKFIIDVCDYKFSLTRSTRFAKNILIQNTRTNFAVCLRVGLFYVRDLFQPKMPRLWPVKSRKLFKNRASEVCHIGND